MIKKKKVTKDNVVKFPTKLSDIDKQIEAVIFAAAEPLDVDTIESKISKKTNVVKSLEKLQQEYAEDRYRPSPLLKRMIIENRTFY